MRLIGQVIGITERAVQRIVADLEQSEYIIREKWDAKIIIKYKKTLH